MGQKDNGEGGGERQEGGKRGRGVGVEEHVTKLREGH